MANINNIVQEAKRLLKKQPYDVAHDLAHHEGVWKTAREVVKGAKISVDFKALKIAAFWHDVVVDAKKQQRKLGERNVITREACGRVAGLLRENDFSKDFIEKVVLAIEYHGFSQRPVNNEGKVLWDADKLEALNWQRWKKIYGSFKHGEMDKEQFGRYVEAGKRFFKNMRQRYNFDYSRKLHDKRLEDLLGNKRAVGVMQQIGREFFELLRVS